MAKTQINFRIEEDLLKAIQKKADKQGISYTAWIINQCKASLGLQPEDLSEGRILDLIEERIKPLNSQITALQEEVSTLKKNLIPAHKESAVSPNQQTHKSQTKKPPRSFTSEELGERFGITKDGLLAAWRRISRQENGDKAFEIYCSERDPDGFTWRYDEERKIFKRANLPIV